LDLFRDGVGTGSALEDLPYSKERCHGFRERKLEVEIPSMRSEEEKGE
jgi:hypothetical protein